MTLRLSRDGTAPMTGAIQLASGTPALPGIVFQADTTSGFFKTTNGIGVAIGGSQVAELTPTGLASGAFLPGMLFPYTCTAAPSPAWVLPFGQTLSRAIYSELWAQAQIEIAAGNTLYNNGDGSTTFGIMDMRGRLQFAWDKMGGTASGRLTTAGGGVDGTTLGASGGAQSKTLVTANLPPIPYTPAGTIAVNPGNAAVNNQSVAAGGGSAGGFSTGANITATFSGTPAALGGSSAPIQISPPALVTNYLLYAGKVS